MVSIEKDVRQSVFGDIGDDLLANHHNAQLYGEVYETARGVTLQTKRANCS